MKKMCNEGNQIHNFMSNSGSGTVINYGSGSDFLTSYGSGSGSTSQKVPVPVPQHWLPVLTVQVNCIIIVDMVKKKLARFSRLLVLASHWLEDLRILSYLEV